VNGGAAPAADAQATSATEPGAGAIAAPVADVRVAPVDERRPWFTRGVRSIGLASFLADLGHEIPPSLLPSFLTATLGAPAAALGLIEGVADGFAGAARLAGGALSDDPHRRRTVALGGYGATAVLSAAIGLCTTVSQVALLRGAGWLARGIRVPARNALLADVVPASAYGRAYGYERAMDNLGAVFGPVLALLLVSLVSVRVAILLSVIPGLLATLAILTAIRATPKPTRRAHQPIRLRVRPVLKGQLGRLMTGVAAFELANVAATLLILRATELFAPDHGQSSATRLALVLYIGYNAAATLVSIPGGHLADRWGESRVLLAGVACFVAAYLGFAFAGPAVALPALAFVAAGVGIGLVETSQHSAVAGLAPLDCRGSAFGLLAAVQSIGQLAASAVAGLLWTLASPRVAFLYLVSWSLVALILFARVRPVRKQGGPAGAAG
jgi:MFS family permease